MSCCQSSNQQVSNQTADAQAGASSCGCDSVAEAQGSANPQAKSHPQGQPQSRPSRTFVPAVDTFEQDGALLLVADVPGAKADEIDIRYEAGELRIRAPIAGRNSGRRFLLQEYEVGHYARAFRIGSKFDPSRIEANFSDGVLTLKLPQLEAAKARKIAVRNV